MDKYTMKYWQAEDGSWMVSLYKTGFMSKGVHYCDGHGETKDEALQSALKQAKSYRRYTKVAFGGLALLSLVALIAKALKKKNELA